MEAKHVSEPKRLSSDIITTLPQSIIETILCLLPTEEAARTSILAREWRYKWTKIPKLVFSESMFRRQNNKNELSGVEEMSRIARARRNMDWSCKMFYNILHVLLLRQGPIHEFAFSMSVDDTCFELDHIILHLSRNHVKKLKLDVGHFSSYCLPFSFFSLHHLTDLCLENCQLNRHTPLFDGFGSLTSMTLNRVTSTKETLLHLLSNCPSLTSICLFVYDFRGGAPSIMELFKCLPMIEHLTTQGETVLLLALYSVPEELPVSLIHLKYCCIEQMLFPAINEFAFLVALMKFSPNLEKIKLEIGSSIWYDLESLKLEEYSEIFEKYSDVWLERLNELEIHDFGNLKPELEYVKFVMARSPNLKKLKLSTIIKDKNEELELLRILLCAPRVSYVEIVVRNRA